jgi:hypothetical protein
LTVKEYEEPEYAMAQQVAPFAKVVYTSLQVEVEEHILVEA